MLRQLLATILSASLSAPLCTYPNGVVHSYGYDTRNRLTNLGVTGTVNGAPGAIASYAYTLDASGHRTAVTELSGRTVNYSYDNLYRLTNETIASDPSAMNGAVSYVYDPVGNRQQKTSTLPGYPGGLMNYNANDQLATDAYDANGNTTGSGANTGANGYVYDFENHLIQQGGISYVYDGDGNRIGKSVGGFSNSYLNAAINPTGYVQVLQENFNGGTGGNYELSHNFVYGLELINERRYYLQNNGAIYQTFYYDYDGHGSVRALTDTTGTVTDSYDYDAFGNLIHSTGTTPNNYLFAGEQFDPDLNLYYNRARYLNVSTGRFWSMDSLEGFYSEPQSLHRYSYCFGDSPNCLDPSGNEGDFASAAAYSGGMITVDTANLINFLKVVGVVGALAVGYAAGPYIDDAFERNKSRFAAFGASATTAVALFQYHFQRWRQDPDFQRGGNHFVDVGLPSGPVRTPRVIVDMATIQIPLTSFRVTLTFYEGGGPGRIFSVQYRIGANATLGRGYFGFRADYLDFRSNPPTYSPHVHWTYSLGGEDQDEDHVPL